MNVLIYEKNKKNERETNIMGRNGKKKNGGMVGEIGGVTLVE